MLPNSFRRVRYFSSLDGQDFLSFYYFRFHCKSLRQKKHVVTMFRWARIIVSRLISFLSKAHETHNSTGSREIVFWNNWKLFSMLKCNFQAPETYPLAMFPSGLSCEKSSSARASGGIWKIYTQNRRCLWIITISATWRMSKCGIAWTRWEEEPEKTLVSAIVTDWEAIRSVEWPRKQQNRLIFHFFLILNNWIIYLLIIQLFSQFLLISLCGLLTKMLF